MGMNPHSLPRFHSRSSPHSVPLYSSTSQSNIRYSRPRMHMSHSSSNHSHPYTDSSWTPAPMIVPSMLQKVYILDCNSCSTFLTNRGMRAVLLLQPEVALYSTDALPVNCSATPGPLQYAPSHDSVAASSSPLSRPSGVPAPIPRTCECLTQTLCCHGCGNAVGYMVVIPCTRCTSSVSPTNRHTNRHRFVFFNKEITASERHYIPHEPGVISSSPVLVSAVPQSSSVSPPSALRAFDSSDTQYSLVDNQYFHSNGPVLPVLATPPDSPMSTDHSQSPHPFPPPANTHHPVFPAFHLVTIKSERVKLRAGDVIYWHNLSRSGEIPAVKEDERARGFYDSPCSPWAGR